MSTVADSIATRVKLSDPKPSHCAACFRGAEAGVQFVDFDAAIDRGQLVVERDGAVWHRDSIDDLHLCEACVRAGSEALALKPALHSSQAREIRRLELAVEHWRHYAVELEQAVASRPEHAPKRRPAAKA